MTTTETIAFRKLQLALEYARNHLVNPENTVMADLFADINEALALAEQVRPIKASRYGEDATAELLRKLRASETPRA